jgi:hypothetical protein
MSMRARLRRTSKAASREAKPIVRFEGIWATAENMMSAVMDGGGKGALIGKDQFALTKIVCQLPD